MAQAAAAFANGDKFSGMCMDEEMLRTVKTVDSLLASSHIPSKMQAAQCVSASTMCPKGGRAEQYMLVLNVFELEWCQSFTTGVCWYGRSCVLRYCEEQVQELARDSTDAIIKLKWVPALVDMLELESRYVCWGTFEEGETMSSAPADI